MEQKPCVKCGMMIAKRAVICPHCHTEQKNKKVKWIAIGAVALFLLLGMCSVQNNQDTDTATDTADSGAPTAVSDSAATASETVDNSTSNSSSNGGYIAVGSSFEENGLKITVNDADLDFTQYDNPYGWRTPNTGMKYVMASFTFENTGSSDRYVSIYDFDCYADDSSCEQVYTLDESGFINTNISKGRTVSFKTYYEVPVNAEKIELEYETNAWTSKKVIIKLK